MADIVGVAVTLAADRGLASITLRDVAGALGVSGPAILHWIPGKEALLDAVVDRVLADVSTTNSRGASIEQLLDLICQLHRVFETYPGVGDRWLSIAPETSAADRIFSEGVALLRQDGLSGDAPHFVLMFALSVATGYGPVARRFGHSAVACDEAAGMGVSANEFRALLEGLMRALDRWAMGDITGRQDPSVPVAPREGSDQRPGALITGPGMDRIPR